MTVQIKSRSFLNCFIGQSWAIVLKHIILRILVLNLYIEEVKQCLVFFTDKRMILMSNDRRMLYMWTRRMAAATLPIANSDNNMDN